MSATVSQLTERQHDIVKRWLNEKGLMRCKACGFSNLTPPSHMVNLGGESATVDHDLLVIPMACAYCGTTVLLNAKIAGLV